MQHSPRLAVVNKQLELMARYMTEFGMTPASRSRVAALDPRMQVEMPTEIKVTFVLPADERAKDALDGGRL